MFYDRAMRRQKNLCDEINEIEKQLLELPEGAFTCQRNGNRYKWRVTKGKQQIYITKDNPQVAEKYAFKKYLTCRLARLKNEKIAIQSYLKIHDRFINTKDEELLSHPEYQRLLSNYFINTKQNMMKWMSYPFKRNPYHEENLIHDTASGVKTRSKGEQMIEAALCRHNLAYRYEEELVLGDAIYYPDFKILHPKTGVLIIWENVGMSDNPEYMFRLMNKLQHYFQYGYYTTINLILTFDTKDNPLTTDRIERIIEMYFED